MKIVESTIDVNKKQRLRMFKKLEDAVGSVAGKRVAVLGLSFKPQTDDVRDSVAIELLQRLKRAGASAVAFDPVANETAAAEVRGVEFASDAYEAAKGADALVIATEWNEFRQLDLAKLKKLLRKPIVVDCRNIYDGPKMREAGFKYVDVGRRSYAPSRSGATGAGKRAVRSTSSKPRKKKKAS